MALALGARVTAFDSELEALELARAGRVAGFIADARRWSPPGLPALLRSVGLAHAVIYLRGGKNQASRRAPSCSARAQPTS